MPEPAHPAPRRTHDAPVAPPPVGALLRHWRAARGKSQLGLAAAAGVSQRHVSFVESGRSVPSRQMLLGLADALQIPLRDRNVLLTAAGYAALYAEPALDAAAMASLGKALDRMLRQHDPYPALVLDRHWNVLGTNDAAPRLFGCFVDLAARPKPRNLLHLVFDPAGLRPWIANWSQTARALLARVHREALGHVVDPDTEALLAALARYPGVKPEWHAPATGQLAPTVPLTLVKHGTALSYFSLVATVGTPQAVTAEELRLECMFPADDATERAHEPFLAAHALNRP